MKVFDIEFGSRAHEYTNEECNLVTEVMRTASPLTQGVHLAALEDKFSRYLGANYAYAVSNATSALELSAQLCQLSAGDEVIVPAHTFTSSAYPFAKHGGKLVWADINLKTRVIGVEEIERCLSSKSKVVVVPHLYGYVADMPEIMEFSKKHNLLVVEDVAQAIGTEHFGTMAGAFGDFSVFSFHAHKNISTLGEGGMIVIRNSEQANVLPMIRHNGHCNFGFERDDYWIPAMGNVDMPELVGRNIWPNNFCLGEVECALAARMLDRVDEINHLKRQRAIEFMDQLSEFPELEFHRENSRRHNYHLLVARLKREGRDSFIRRMASDYGIQCVVQYYPLYRYSFYRKLGLYEADCPNTDLFFDNMISFPFAHSLSENQLSYIVSSVSKVLKLI